MYFSCGRNIGNLKKFNKNLLRIRASTLFELTDFLFLIMNYRKYYEEFTNTKLNPDFDVHHIDGDKDNNDISNLVALPKNIHSEYHRLKNIELNLNTDLKSILDNGHKHNEFALSQAFHFVKIHSECNKWMDYKMYLLDYIPNIHNLKYN